MNHNEHFRALKAWRQTLYLASLTKFKPSQTVYLNQLGLQYFSPKFGLDFSNDLHHDGARNTKLVSVLLIFYKTPRVRTPQKNHNLNNLP